MPSDYKCQSTSIDDSSIPIEQSDQSCQLERLQFSSFDGLVTTYKGGPHYRVKVLARELHTSIIGKNSIFDLNLRQWTCQDLNPDLQDKKLLR